MEYGDLNKSTVQINDILDNALLKKEQTLTEEEKSQVLANIGVDTLIGDINTILDNINGEVIS